MKKINTAITGVAAYVPEDKLTNEDLTKMVDTTDEWIYSRVGIKRASYIKRRKFRLVIYGLKSGRFATRKNRNHNR